MSLVTRSLPGLFGGVSQQVPALRHPTHCSEQDNALATLVAGLFKRPGSRHLHTLPLNDINGQSVQGSNGAAYAHTIDRGTGELFELVLVNGNMALYSRTTGAIQSVSFPNGKTYLNASDPESDFRCVTVADYTFIVNRKKTVGMLPYTTPANTVNVAYVHIRTAVPKVTYKALVNGTVCWHTTGDTATSDGIAVSLANAINTTMGSGYSAYHMGGNVVKITRADGQAFTCTSEDGWGNQATQTLHQGVDTFAQLPATFEQGYVLRVNGSLEGGKNKYYVQYANGRWTECPAPGLQSKLDPSSMPHQLIPVGDGTWRFGQCVWDERKVGDNETNPLPSFVGTTLRSIFFFRNRLGVLADDALVLSRAGQYFNWFASSAVQVLDTDPIDLGATSEQVVALEWAVPFNQNMLVWASDKQQFVLTGGEILSPNNARLLPTTTFEWFKGVRPASLGNKVLFAANRGAYAQLNVFRVADDTVSNMAEDVTEHCPEYVPANLRMVVASTLAKAAVAIPAGPTKELYVFKYETDERDRLSQKAWCCIRFDTADTVRIIHAHWQSYTLHLLKHVVTSGDPVAGGRFVAESIDLSETAKDAYAGFGLRLDTRALVAPTSFDGVNTLIDVPYLAPVNELTLLKCADGAEPLPLTVASSVADTVNLRTRVTVEGNHMGANVWVGRKYLMRYKFSEPVLRDTENLPIMAASVKLVRWVVRYVKTGWFRAKVTPHLRATYEYPFSGRTIGQPGQGPSQLALSTGEFAIPVQAKAANTDVVIETDSYLPVNIPYAEWVGDVTLKAKR